MSDDESIINTRQLEAFSRKVTATASFLIADSAPATYHAAVGDIHRELRRPLMQRSLFSFTQSGPRELVRSTLSSAEIQHRALASIPDELLAHVPEPTNAYSLFQGFQASLPDADERRRGRRRSRRLLTENEREEDDGAPPQLRELRNEKLSLHHRLEMLGVRKNMCSTEIREIDTKIANLHHMRTIVLERLAGLETEELDLEAEISGVDNRLEDLTEELEDAAQRAKTPSSQGDRDPAAPDFMSESIYEKIPEPRSRRKRANRRTTTPILHEHLEPGSRIKELHAHTDAITALDFDVPFGTMVTAALDDTVRVWDLNAGRCMGLLEGHLSSVRCLQVEDEIVATGSSDASIRLWDLSRAAYAPRDNRITRPASAASDDGLDYHNEGDEPPPPPPTSMADCPLFSLSAHVAEVTALHFRGNTLVSGSADKTLRQWDLEKGRCVQTLDVLWAAAQAGTEGGVWRGQGRGKGADFVGALQCFDAALACGTADGMVRLWDLRSGQVHRSLVGHTGPVTALQFDDVHLVTGSGDRSIRIWDLRTGSIYDAFAYDNPISSMMFDARRIVAAAGEDVVKVYDKTDGRHWECGPAALAAREGTESRAAVVERVRIRDGWTGTGGGGTWTVAVLIGAT
ncbi:WD repeat-containing protein [Trichodelitschia bisporula]|uniref:Mitochondrial division protein 1 n=1 Tax=Trichodelitschia bisporula TaxID=703511 RepID=A0A6G1HID7_9PEZI|nr:WD repeat-containing protein [Trichodelitschia bisporula]